MATMDIFNNNAFSVTSLTGMIQKTEYQPGLLGQLGLFEKRPVRTRNVFVDRVNSSLRLISTSADGAPPEPLEPDTRDAVSLRTNRLTKRFTLYAHELDGLRASGTESELMSVQTEYAARAGRLRKDMELTHEFHRLGALQGKLLDADGTTVIRDYFQEFGITEKPAIVFDLNNPELNIRQVLVTMVRDMSRTSGGTFTPTTTVHALAGDEFYDKLIMHPTVEKTYMNWAAAADLRNSVAAFGSFTYGGVTWHNYRGTDDNTTVAVAPDEAKFFPVGADGVFVEAMAPLETLDYVGTPGQEVYMMNIPDRERNMWTKGEIYSYPLHICQQPDVLRKGVIGVA